MLTRLPPPHRLEGALAAELLETWFPGERTLVPLPALGRGLVGRCADGGVQGGAVYDALVALTAAEADATLDTRDRRAALTYRRVGRART